MASLFKKLFGKVESAGSTAKTHAQQTTDNASPAAADAQGRLAEARDQATGAGASAQAQGMGGVFSEIGGMFAGGIPDMAQIESAIGKLSTGELSGVLSKALSSVPSGVRDQLGQAIERRAPAAAPASSGAAMGNPSDLGSALAGILKGGGGLGALAGLLSPSGGATGQVAGGQGFNLTGLLQNPMAKQVLSAILPAIMKAAGKQ